MITFRWSIVLLSAVVLHLVGVAPVLAQSASPTAQPDGQAIPQTSSPGAGSGVPAQTNPVPAPETLPSGTDPISQEAVPSCPAGQFASAFPDVPPDHWAYEAVNRLAATPIRCFPTAPRLL